MGNGRLPAIPDSQPSAVCGELKESATIRLSQAVAHHGCHQRRQKFAGKEAHAEPPYGCDPNGRSNCPSGRRPRTKLQRRMASVAIRTWEPHEERLRQRLALWVRQVGRSRGGGISSEQQVPRDQYCWIELDQSVSGEIIAATVLSKIAKTLKFLYRYTHLFNTKVKKRIQ